MHKAYAGPAPERAVNPGRVGCGHPHIDGSETVTERKRSKAEERSYAALLNEIEELKRWEELQLLEKETRDRRLKQEMIPAAWQTVERDVPVRPKKVRVTAAYEEELVRWTLLFSGSGQDSGGNGATDDGATCGLMPDCGLVVPIGAHAGAALVSRKT
jgi:hypothetical protein